MKDLDDITEKTAKQIAKNHGYGQLSVTGYDWDDYDIIKAAIVDAYAQGYEDSHKKWMDGLPPLATLRDITAASTKTVIGREAIQKWADEADAAVTEPPPIPTAAEAQAAAAEKYVSPEEQELDEACSEPDEDATVEGTDELWWVKVGPKNVRFLDRKIETVQGEWTKERLRAMYIEAGESMQPIADAVNAALREQMNEGHAIRRLSDALTGGNAGTWDEIFHAAEQHNAALKEGQQQQLYNTGLLHREQLEKRLQAQQQDTKRLQTAIDAMTDIGVYPAKVIGGDKPYDQRTEWMEGWNAALQEVVRVYAAAMSRGEKQK